MDPYEILDAFWAGSIPAEDLASWFNLASWSVDVHAIDMAGRPLVDPWLAEALLELPA